ncbi:type I restriction-modification system subunit M [Candidatus Palauibacter sp.]|uniref:type I restriction-modification system subunit M n=1 Tax=Candidatus Palauibacter sp. TaxID=3101350 RepID=UPI003C6FE91C
MTHTEIVSFIWDVANLIRDSFKRGKYQDVILPLTVLRRLDCVLAPTKEKVLARKAELRGLGLEDMDAQLKKAAGFAFYNTSRYDFERLLGDAPALAANLRNYIVGFSDEMREVIERFDFDNTISKLDESQLLYQVVERFGTLDLHPDVVDNATMGTIFEELIRKFNEALDENPGEHFTPRDVVHLMVELMLAGDEEELSRVGTVRSVYDPCCGSGGMLMIAKQRILKGREENGELLRPPINREADIHLFGQEVNPETWAVSRSDFFMKDPEGHDAKRIAFGSTLSNDRHAGQHFDYLIANPPYGKDWKRDKDAVKAEHERGAAGRFGPGLPRISDGQTLFLLHMLARARPPGEGGTRIAIIMNGSPLFTGDAGSGESEIRRHILENDLLEALIALPEQLFYNTGIGTYIWLLTNRKAPERAGKVQLIDATAFWSPLKKSLGDKRREIPPEKAADIFALHRGFEDDETRTVSKDGDDDAMTVSRIFPMTRFGFRRITVERPLKLNFQGSEERIARLDGQTAFANLARSRKRGEAGEREKAEGEALQASIRTALGTMPSTLYKDRDTFGAELDAVMERAEIKLRIPVRKAALRALSERDETAEVCRDARGEPEPDPRLRDTERVPLPDGDDPADDEGVPESVREFFEREVKPHASDAWIDTTKRDRHDGEVGLVGYEINFNRYFYRFKPPRPLEEIEADIGSIGADIVKMLREVAHIPYGSES